MASAQPDLQVKIRSAVSQVELSWPTTLLVAPGQIVFPAYQIQKSVDLKNWEAVSGTIRGRPGTSGGTLRSTIYAQGSPAFYRIVAELNPAPAGLPPSGGAEVFGYATEFAQELKRIGQISPQEFAARYPSGADYLPDLTANPVNGGDPRRATFWDAFNTDPAEYNRNRPPGADPRLYDFRLNAGELAVFLKNGFVVSERLGSQSFAETFYRIFTDDLPVFVSADAVLHAWHRSYVTMLEELEETYLSDAAGRILDGMAARIPLNWKRYGTGALRDSLLDADYFLAVSRSLMAGERVSSYLNQDARVANALSAIAGEQFQEFDLFGQCRTVDFSQFKVRGHYESSERLKRYFRTIMWLGRIDLRITPGSATCDGQPPEDSVRQLGTAIVLQNLLSESGLFDQWQQFDKILQVFVGWTDSMTFAQLGGLLAAANIRSLADVPDRTALTNLQSRLLTGELGAQSIRSDYYISPFGPAQIQLPRSFTVFGQKFILDSWALSLSVFDSIIWNGDKVQRRRPSSLDVAFGVLGNNQIVPELVARMTNPNGHKFRDGLPYQHNLAAVRNVIDRQNAAVWEDNIYMNWLTALRELSAPTTDPRYPASMRTRAWAMKTLNTQLASWTQLRHDTVLYAKQSYTGAILCFYPAGFVEPTPTFWEKLKGLASRAASLIEATAFQGQVTLDRTTAFPKTQDLATIQQRQVAFLRKFAETVGTLQTIAGKELAQEKLTDAEAVFLRSLIESTTDTYTGEKHYSGWYPALFYRSILQGYPLEQNEGSDKWDAIVTDVHTDVPAPVVEDPGAVLHEGIGNVHLLMISVDNGPDRMVYAGPVMSHYEFEPDGIIRKSDSEWKADIKAGKLPPHPEWTKSYLVPGNFVVPPGYE